MYYSGGKQAEKGVAIVVHKSVVRSVVKKIVYDDRIIAIKLQAQSINILVMQVYKPTLEHEDDELEELYSITEKILKKMERVTQTPSLWGNGIVLLEINHIGTLLDHMA